MHIYLYGDVDAACIVFKYNNKSQNCVGIHHWNTNNKAIPDKTWDFLEKNISLIYNNVVPAFLQSVSTNPLKG